MTKKTPAALMSYVHTDDKYKQLSTLRERLSDEVQMQIGIEFPIFQDTKDIHWGQNWEERIESALSEEITFLIPIITPSFFNSEPCRDELERFLEVEKQLKRNDLIRPIYFVDTPLLNDAELRATDPLAEELASRQYADWRELRFESFTNPLVGKTLAELAKQIRDALPAVQTAKKATKARPEPDPATTSEAREQPTESRIAKLEPPTCIVDSMHRGNFTTLTEAIKNVEPGTRILVRKGFYKEGLVIDKPLEIIGDGDVGDVVIQASGMSVISFQTMMGRIVNLTLRQAGDGEWFSVDIGQGRLEIEDCDITSQSLACVAIHGGSDPRLRRNRIHDCKSGSGVFVYENSQGTLEDNDIFNNAHTGVAISEGSNPTLRRNLVHSNKQAGVMVYKAAQGTLEDNEIATNNFSGVEIKQKGNPTLRRNRIHDNQAGVYLRDGGKGALEDNDIFGNQLAGVQTRNADATLRGNRIHDNKQSGVYVNDAGHATLEDNDVFRNGFNGAEIRTAGNAIAKNNRINKNPRYAVRVYENGGGTFENNDLTDNYQGSWFIAADSEANVTRANNKE